MEEKQFYKLLEGIQRIETSQAVLKEKLTQMDQRLDSTNKRAVSYTHLRAHET